MPGLAPAAIDASRFLCASLHSPKLLCNLPTVEYVRVSEIQGMYKRIASTSALVCAPAPALQNSGGEQPVTGAANRGLPAKCEGIGDCKVQGNRRGAQMLWRCSRL